MPDDSSNLSPDAEKRHFATTQWSVVLAAGDVGRRRTPEPHWRSFARTIGIRCMPTSVDRVNDVHEAQDLTQAFFSHLLEKRAIAKADRNRGRFRAFLLTALKNFLTNEWEKARAEKRGGGKTELSLDFDSGESRYQIEPSHALTAEKLFERRWVLTLLDQVLERSANRTESKPAKPQDFEQFKGAADRRGNGRRLRAGGGGPGDHAGGGQAGGVSDAQAVSAAFSPGSRPDRGRRSGSGRRNRPASGNPGQLAAKNLCYRNLATLY